MTGTTSIQITVSPAGGPPPAGAPKISVSPSSLAFGDVTVGQTKDLSLTVQNSGNAILTISSSSNTSPRFTLLTSLPLGVAAGQSGTLFVRFAPIATGAVSGSLTITSNDPSTPSLSIGLTGNGAGTTGGNPAINVSATTLDFGSITVGQTKDLSFNIRNGGAGTLSVTSITGAAAPFTLVQPPQTPFNVPAAGTVITARFSPTTGGPQSGTLTIASNGGNATIPLSGTGIASTPSQNVLLSDSFNRANAFLCGLGKADLAFGGSGTWFYMPVWPNPLGAPIGAGIVSGTLQNNGQDFGGVQITTTADTCITARGATLPQDLDITVDLSVPGSTGKITSAGPYFRSRSAAPGDGLFGGTSSGYWVELRSTGDVHVQQMNPIVDIAATAVPASFNAGVFHTLEAIVQGGSLQVKLDGSPLTFTQNGAQTATVSVSTAGNDGAAGISFGAELNRGQAGGQSARNLIIASPTGTAPAPVIAAAPASLSFGNVPVGQSPTMTFAISNKGNAPMNVTGMTAAAPFAVISPSVPFTVAAGASVTVTVSFTAVAGPQTGTVAIASNGGSLSIPLTGTGTTSGGACVAPAANTVSWWSGDGNASDLTGGNSGTTRGGTTFAAGEVAQAFQFDGSTGDVLIGSPANLQLTSAITIEAWINPRSVNSQVAGSPMGAILTRWAQNFSDTPDSDGYGLWLAQSGTAVTLFSAIHQPGGREPNVQGGSIPLNAWTHVAMTFDGTSGQYTLYVNGQSVASTNSAGPMFASTHNVLIGREDSFIGRAFNGLIDEVTVYSRALSASEIQAIFNAGSQGKCKPAAPPAATLDVTPRNLDFGSVNTGQSKDLTFAVKNNGGAGLSAIVTGGSAAFTATPSSALSVAANSSQTVTVHFAPTAAGPQLATFTVATTDLSQTISVSVTGTGVSAPPASTLGVTPSSVDFGNVTTGQGKDLTLAVKNTGGASLTAIVSSSNPAFTVNPSSSFTVGANSSVSVTVHFAPTSAGAQSASLKVATTDGAQSISVAASGTGVAPPSTNISASPSSLDYGNVNGGELKELGFTLTNTGTAAVAVTSVTSSNPHFYIRLGSPPFTLAAGNGAVFISFYFAPELPGPQTGTITIAFSDPGVPPVKVPISGTGVGAWVSPDHLTFGTVKVNQTQDMSISVKGNLNKVITCTVTTSNPVFVLPFGSPVTLFSGQNVLVRFSPTAVGPQSGTITITADDPLLGTFQVPVTGTGN
jgi:hypothetical protein